MNVSGLGHEINIQGKCYHSIRAFLKEHGFSRSRFNKHLRYEEGKDKYILAAGRLLKLDKEELIKPKIKKISITVWGNQFESIAEACRFFAIKESDVNRDCKKGILPEESIINRVGLNSNEFSKKRQKISSLNKFLYTMKAFSLEMSDERKCFLQENDRVYRYRAYENHYRISQAS
ncbi:hypothetical protein L3V82_11905 [Thiotrichales bacterium 19S3-7]|nr:hypothetical protein [Thiotrichales bacterium 19S3-7]MCF6802798.1 hypothetical protein [Thiotrichales bacterium 19S3-11]